MAKTIRRRIAAIASVLTFGLILSACSSPESNVGGEAAADLDAALAKGGTIEYWSWAPSAADQVALFMKKYKDVTVNLTNTGAVAEHNLKLQNALTAGSGIPDVAQLEYQSVPQFQLSGDLEDLTGYGFAELENLFTAPTWQGVSQNGGIWGLPQDSAPMALFYNAEVLDSNGIAVPATWDEYIAVGKSLRAANPDSCLLNDTGSVGLANALIWQAGGRPFQVKGETVTVNLQDKGSLLWADTWNQVIQGGLNCEFPSFTSEWISALGDGTIATVPSGAWMEPVLEQLIPESAGKWKVAPMPTYDGTPSNAEQGGSGQVVLQGAANPALGAAFIRWLNTAPESTDFSPGLPAVVAALETDEFLNRESKFFSGEKVNKVFVDGIKDVGAGWQYLPWQAYANNIYVDTVGQSFLNRSDLKTGLLEWQKRNIAFGKDQGFSMSKD